MDWQSTSRSGDLKSPSNWSAVLNRRSLIAFTTLVTASLMFAEQPVSPINADWTRDAPGVRHKITLADLPPPYATESVNNGPRVVRRPSGAQLQVPAGFKIEEYASGFVYPRFLLTAPN